MPGNISYIEENMPHKVSEVVCLMCLSRFICARPCNVLLKELQCDACGETGYIVETGESMEIEE